MESGGGESARWKGKVGERKELRRPRPELGETDESHSPNMKPESRASGEAVTRSSLPTPSQNETLMEVTSTLSPFAKEFIPREFIPADSNLSPYAKEFTPAGQPNDTTSTNNEDTYEGSRVTDEYPVPMVEQLVYEVTMRPASFDSEVRILTENLKEHTVTDRVLRAVVDVIVNQAIEEPNFRYNGARMCNHLSQHLEHNNFRSMVLNACNAIFNQSNELLSSPEGQATYRGFALFLGEIFSQMRIQNNRITTLGEKLPKILENILGFPNSDNLKCVCQVIKFVGCYLEDQERASNEEKKAPIMDKIIARIDECAALYGDTLDRCIKGMCLAVVELRTANYGRRALSPAISTEILSTNSVTTDPICYGPDGQPMTAEEALFLDSQYLDVPNGEDYGYEDHYESEDMDDEMCTAFEEFLREMPPH